MKVSWRRGLLRAWIIVSLLWVGTGVAVLTATTWDGPCPYRETAKKEEPAPKTGSKADDKSKVWDKKAMDDLRKKLLEPETLTLEQVEKLNRQNPPCPWGWLIYNPTSLLILIVPPVLLLAIGSALVWIMRGFRTGS